MCAYFPSFFSPFIFLYVLSPQPGLLTKQACLKGSTLPWVEWEATPADVFAAATSPLHLLTCSRVQLCVEREQNCPVGSASGWRGVSGEEWGKGRVRNVYSIRKSCTCHFLFLPGEAAWGRGLGEQHHCWVGSPRGTAEGCIVLCWLWVAAFGVFLSPHNAVSALCTGRWPCCFWAAMWSLFCDLDFLLQPFVFPPFLSMVFEEGERSEYNSMYSWFAIHQPGEGSPASTYP